MDGAAGQTTAGHDEEMTMLPWIITTLFLALLSGLVPEPLAMGR